MTMDAPAPWSLSACGYLLALKRDEADPFATRPELEEPWIAPLGFVLFVDYASSPVGPYHELLFIPGTFRFAGERLPSITKIYVSTQASIDNGRRNWGIPKELARFTVSYGDDGVDRVQMFVGEERAVELAFAHGRLKLPVASWLLPAPFRTLGQKHHGRTLITRPSARGAVQRAKLVHAWSDARFFAPLAPARVAASVRLADVRLEFPQATAG